MEGIEVRFTDQTVERDNPEGQFTIIQGALQVWFDFTVDEITTEQAARLATGVKMEIKLDDHNGYVQICNSRAGVRFHISRMTSQLEFTLPFEYCRKAFNDFAKWHAEGRV